MHLFAKVDANAKSISAFSSAKYIPMAGKKLMMPSGTGNFGKSGITAFINFEGLNLKSFELDEGQEVLYLIKYVTLEMDDNGSVIIIKAKKGNENLLKQAVDVLVKQFAGKIGEISV